MRQIFEVFSVAMVCGLWLCSSHTIQADVVWNEAVDGDLSDDPSAPTPLTFTRGANTIIGSLFAEPGDDLRDYITFTINPNQFLTAIILDAYSPAGVSFHGINSGSTSFIPDFGTADQFLGLEFLDEGMLGTDLMPALAAGQWGSIGFTIPLGPGTYSYVIQEITPGETRDYQLTFQVVPEPSSAFFCCVAGVATILRRGRRK